MLFNNNQKPNKYFLGFLGFLSSFSFLSCCVCGNPGTWGWCLKRYIGNCGACGMGINPRIRGYLHLWCQNRGAVHATTSNTYFRTINTHDMPVALSYFPSG